jgi:hypothetical protein
MDCLVQACYAQELLTTIQQYGLLQQSSSTSATAASKAIQELGLPESASLRNIIMHLPLNHQPACTVESILEFHGLASDTLLEEIFPAKLKKQRMEVKKQTRQDHIRTRDRIMKLIFDTDEGVLKYFKDTYPLLQTLLQQKVLLCGILGDNVIRGQAIIPMQLLHERLAKTVELIQADINLNLNAGKKIGLLWVKSQVGRTQILKTIASKFHIHLNEIAKQNYLDVILGLEVNGVAPPKLRSKPANASVVQGFNIKSNTTELVGSTLVWEDFLSPEFIDGYYKPCGFPSVTWLRESNQHHKGKDRLLSFEALGTTYENPYFLKYGKDKSARMVSSKPMSPVGLVQIKCAHYLDQLFHDFVKERLMWEVGETTAKSWMPSYQPTDSIVQSLNGQFSWHSDAKDMLVDPHDSKNNKSVMTVTTMTMNSCPTPGAASLLYRESESETILQ